VGGAREAYVMLHNHFYRPTQAGKQHANRAFYNMTMANTDTDVGKFMAQAKRNAKIVTMHGEVVSEGTIISIILDGLLDEFEPLVLLLQFEQNPSLAGITAKILDFAKTKGFENLTKGGNANSRTKTFHVADKGNSKRKWRGTEEWLGGDNDCQQWLRNKCPRGDKCTYHHAPGKGGFATGSRGSTKSSPVSHQVAPPGAPGGGGRAGCSCCTKTARMQLVRIRDPPHG
jgi:hypothetical protein